MSAALHLVLGAPAAPPRARPFPLAPAAQLQLAFPEIRRSLVSGAAGALAAVMVAHGGGFAPPPASAAAGAGPAALTPYERGFRLEYGLQDDRIRKCDGGAQPNCVSTSSLSNLYSPPWIAGDQPPAALEELDAALRELWPQAELVKSEATAGGVYARYRIPSSFEYDVVEVLIARQRPPYEADPPLVTFRMQAGTLKYVWPITQPVSDMGAQRKRAAALRAALGWRINGGDCTLQECFQE